MNDRFTIRDAKDSIRIDRDNLDEAIIEQASLYQEVSARLVQAKQEKDTLKIERNKVEAEVSSDERKRFTRDKEKFTESSLREQVILDDDYQEAHLAYTKSLNEVEAWEFMKEAYSQRSFMIRELARLWAANYYGDTSASGGEAVTDRVSDSNRRKQSSDRKQRSNRRKKLNR